MSVETGLMTVAAFEQVPDPPSGHYELHHGHLVLMPPRKKSHMKIQQTVFDLLSPLVAGRGFLTIEFAFRPAPEYEVWQADLGFVMQDRWAKDTNDYFLGAPDWVIEVLLPSNIVDEILERQDISLQNGCTAFWTLDPKRKSVMVTTPDRTTVTCDASMHVLLPLDTGDKVLAADMFR
jgi:Uma2 family endonuclease